MPRSILLVDDDPVVRMLVSEYLSAFGHQVTAVEGGRECFAALEGMAPDLVIVDYQMPEMSGLQVLERLKSSEGTKSIPVIMLSANAVEGEDSSGVKADKYVMKPFQLQEFLAAVESIGISK